VGGRTVKTRTTRAGRVSSYEEVRLWLAAELGIQVKYDVVHKVHEKLKADKKVARPKKRARASAVENFKKELAQKLTSVFKEEKQSKSLRECDIGVKMKPAGIENCAEKKVDIQGVKPVGSLQFSRENIMCGVVEPESGDNFFREISHLDTECFGISK